MSQTEIQYEVWLWNMIFRVINQQRKIYKTLDISA